MKCPNCHQQNHRVLETRSTDSNTIRRRKSCDDCGQRWTTYERSEPCHLDVNFNSRGSKNHNAVLTENNVRDMRKEYSDGSSYAAIAGKYGVGQSTVSRIVRRMNWTHVV
jgi:transcriptional regulator NrdR family protein